MLRTRWYKVLIDLWRNRARTLIVALAVAVGVYAVGVVVSVREVLVREYGSDQAGGLTAAAIVYTQPFDDDLAERIAEMPQVAAAEGRNILRGRVTATAGEPRGSLRAKPRDIVLGVYSDYEQMTVDAITPLAGKWPPDERDIILERLSVDYLDTAIGKTLTLELDDGAERELTIVGTAHDPQVLGPDVTHTAVGYVTRDTMELLGLDPASTELHLRVAEHTSDKAHIHAVVDQVEEQLERTGREVLSRTVITESQVRPFIDTVVLLLSSFGGIVLLLSGFLVVNAISALITQQIPQIGVMKLIGARRWQIMSQYVVIILVYGLIAVLIGIPLGILTARFLMTGIVEDLLNVMPESYSVSVPVIAIQVAIGLLLPLLAGLIPVIKGTSITTQEALSNTGLASTTMKRGWLERVLEQLQRLAAVRRPIVLAIRNTMRHKGRLAQTLFVLVMGTALFISVLSVRTSVDATLASFIRFHQYDVSIGLEQPYRITRLEAIAEQVPGVVEVESWSIGRAILLRPDGTESDRLRVYAVPADTNLMSPEIMAGQWLNGGGRSAVPNALVVNSDALDDEPDLRLGETVTLEIGGREATWHVVGIVPTESKGPALFVAHEDYAFAARNPGKATHVRVRTERNDPASQRAVESALYQQFETAGLDVSDSETAQAVDTSNKIMFTVVVAFLILMALLLAAVGGLGLTTTMSINVLERVREIGVLRAIGASNLSVRRIVLAEGMAMGVVSWVIGALLSLPISAFMSNQVGLALIDLPLSYEYSGLAAVVWFFALQLVAIVASLGPAQRAVRLTVREVLAYE